MSKVNTGISKALGLLRNLPRINISNLKPLKERKAQRIKLIHEIYNEKKKTSFKQKTLGEFFIKKKDAIRTPSTSKEPNANENETSIDERCKRPRTAWRKRPFTSEKEACNDSQGVNIHHYLFIHFN
ncbi:hypothetical protein GQR58_024944 [Nymphon striatum]|nr:hypothetical protein GQR58_024944 [Nymphon striatum]